LSANLDIFSDGLPFSIIVVVVIVVGGSVTLTMEIEYLIVQKLSRMRHDHTREKIMMTREGGA